MPYEIYATGMVLEEYIDYPETMKFDLTAGQIVVVMSREHIKRYPLGGYFEFRFQPVYNTIFLLMKYGNCPWMSAPYSPNLSGEFKAKAFEDGTGLSLTILQICNEDGKIYKMSLVGLKNEFSNLLYCTADIIYQTVPFDLQEHKKVIAAIYDKYATDEEFAETCDEDCRCIIE